MAPIGKLSDYAEKCPEVPEDLVAFLIKLNPIRPPALDQTEREIFREVGRQEIIAWLQFQLDMQMTRAKTEST